MKRYILTIGIMTAVITSQSSLARGGISGGFSTKPRLTQVAWNGTFQCEEKAHSPAHEKTHDCSLEFIDDESGRSWNVKSNPTLTELHQKYGRAVKARIEAMRSPRYLLGGSYVEVQRISLLSDSVANPSSTENGTNQLGNQLKLEGPVLRK